MDDVWGAEKHHPLGLKFSTPNGPKMMDGVFLGTHGRSVQVDQTFPTWGWIQNPEAMNHSERPTIHCLIFGLPGYKHRNTDYVCVCGYPHV